LARADACCGGGSLSLLVGRTTCLFLLFRKRRALVPAISYSSPCLLHITALPFPTTVRGVLAVRPSLGVAYLSRSACYQRHFPPIYLYHQRLVSRSQRRGIAGVLCWLRMRGAVPRGFPRPAVHRGRATRRGNTYGLSGWVGTGSDGGLWVYLQMLPCCSLGLWTLTLAPRRARTYRWQNAEPLCISPSFILPGMNGVNMLLPLLATCCREDASSPNIYWPVGGFGPGGRFCAAVPLPHLPTPHLHLPSILNVLAYVCCRAGDMNGLLPRYWQLHYALCLWRRATTGSPWPCRYLLPRAGLYFSRCSSSPQRVRTCTLLVALYDEQIVDQRFSSVCQALVLVRWFWRRIVRLGRLRFPPKHACHTSPSGFVAAGVDDITVSGSGFRAAGIPGRRIITPSLL